MKKTVIYLFSILIISATLSSCAKTNANKLSGDWTISSLSDVSTLIDNNGLSTTTVTINGTTITVNEEVSNGSDFFATGVVNSATITFEKDGTWSRTLSYTLDNVSGTNNTLTISNITSDSGTWSFIDKNKSAELKANDRILLSILSSSSLETISQPLFGVNTENNSSNTYSEGENTETLLVENSTKSELVVSANENNVSTYNGTTSTTTKVSNWTLTK